MRRSVALAYRAVPHLNDDNGSCYDPSRCHNGCWEPLMSKSGAVEFDIISAGGLTGPFIGDGRCGFAVPSVVAQDW